MIIFAETERLVLRELLPADDEALFEMDADPEVHRYLGNNPITTIDQARNVIAIIRKQYADNGIGRWAVAEKSSGQFIGWSGLKLITDPINDHSGHLDLGYRFLKKHWGKGFASETTIPALAYGFNRLGHNTIYGIAHTDNLQSCRVLKKAGLQWVESFEWDHMPHHWFRMTREEWLKQNNQLPEVL